MASPALIDVSGKTIGRGFCFYRGPAAAGRRRCFHAVFFVTPFANDFTIRITVLASDEYLNICWRGQDYIGGYTYVKAKFPLINPAGDTIVLDYNGSGHIDTKHLYDAGVYAHNSQDAAADRKKVRDKAKHD